MFAFTTQVYPVHYNYGIYRDETKIIVSASLSISSQEIFKFDGRKIGMKSSNILTHFSNYLNCFLQHLRAT